MHMNNDRFTVNIHMIKKSLKRKKGLTKKTNIGTIKLTIMFHTITLKRGSTMKILIDSNSDCIAGVDIKEQEDISLQTISKKLKWRHKCLESQ